MSRGTYPVCGLSCMAAFFYPTTTIQCVPLGHSCSACVHARGVGLCDPYEKGQTQLLYVAWNGHTDRMMDSFLRSATARSIDVSVSTKSALKLGHRCEVSGPVLLVRSGGIEGIGIRNHYWLSHCPHYSLRTVHRPNHKVIYRICGDHGENHMTATRRTSGTNW